MRLYTIGHSNHKIEYFLSLLNKYNIKNLIDIRSQPYSRYNPQYNRENLKKDLSKNSVNYIFMGHKLGGKLTNIFLNHDKTNFDIILDILKKTKEFEDGINYLINLINNNFNFSIMCAEENPLNCHRYHLISKFIIKNHSHIEILHIRGNGDIDENINLTIYKKNNNKSSKQLLLFN